MLDSLHVRAQSWSLIITFRKVNINSTPLNESLVSRWSSSSPLATLLSTSRRERDPHPFWDCRFVSLMNWQLSSRGSGWHHWELGSRVIRSDTYPTKYEAHVSELEVAFNSVGGPSKNSAMSGLQVASFSFFFFFWKYIGWLWNCGFRYFSTLDRFWDLQVTSV